MTDALSFGVLSFTSLFTIIDPIAAAPVFVALTEKQSAERKRAMAMKACLVAFSVLIVFAVCGGFIFKMFGITVDALRIAGGILFFVSAMQMLTGHAHSESDEKTTDADIAIVPLGIPLICGPGAISTVMVLVGQHRTPLYLGSFLIALLAVLTLTALTLILAPKILRFIGQSGVEVITKIIGLILCTLGVQFIIDGLRPIVSGMLHP